MRLKEFEQFEYTYVGAQKPVKDLYIDVTNGTYNKHKPDGGFWSSPFNNVHGCVCDWTDYMSEHPSRYMAYGQTNGFLFNIDEDSSIYSITNQQELMHAYQNYSLADGKYINYEAISEKYDALFVNPTVHNTLRSWSVRTLLIFNMDILTEYLPIKLEINNGSFITSSGIVSKTIEPVSDYSRQVKYMIYEFLNQKLSVEDCKSRSDKIHLLEETKNELLAFIKSIDHNEKYEVLLAAVLDTCAKQKKLI